MAFRVVPDGATGQREQRQGEGGGEKAEVSAGQGKMQQLKDTWYRI